MIFLKENKSVLLGMMIFFIGASFFLYTERASASVQSISLCVKNSGVVFVIGQGFSKADCQKNDKVIDLSLNPGVPGPQGPQGEPGVPGPIGPEGPQGIPGQKGDKGDMGEVGLQGEQGPKGDKGDKGDTGEQGLTGSAGADGATGPAGSQGPKGDTGLAGADGKDGTNGISGWERLSISSGSTTSDDIVLNVTCSSGKKVMSGGYFVSTSVTGHHTISNYPSSDNVWTVHLNRTSSNGSWALTAYAICASAL